MQNEINFLDEKAQAKAKRFLVCEAELLEVLHEVDTKRVFEAFSYPSLFRYCVDRLRLSESYAYAFISVSRKSCEVPELKKAVCDGLLSVSQAKRIVSVIEPGNASQWIEAASTQTQRELEKAVAETQPEPLPSSRIKRVGGEMSEVKLVVPEEMRKKLERLMEVRGGTMLEAFEFALSDTLKRHDPIEKAKRTKSDALPEPQLSLRKAKRVRLPAAMKHEVTHRDEGQCTHQDALGKRCSNRKWVEIHHRVPVSQGGIHCLGNLTTLCSAHHRILHATSPGRSGIL